MAVKEKTLYVCVGDELKSGSDDIKLDVNSIPDSTIDQACSILAGLMKRYYADPENARKFKEWLEQHPEYADEEG